MSACSQIRGSYQDGADLLNRLLERRLVVQSITDETGTVYDLLGKLSEFDRRMKAIETRSATKSSRRRKRPTAIPALLRAKEAADLCGVSLATWERWTSAGKNPSPYRPSSRIVLWNRTELDEWIVAEMPVREEWEKTRPTKTKSR